MHPAVCFIGRRLEATILLTSLLGIVSSAPSATPATTQPPPPSIPSTSSPPSSPALTTTNVCQNPDSVERRNYIRDNITFFPPGESSVGKSDSVKMDVLLGLFDIVVTSINQDAGTFSASFETDMYWLDSDCLQSTSLMYACANRIGTWYFVYAPEEDATQMVTQTTYNVMGSDTAGVLPDAYGSGCQSGDFLRTSTTIRKRFDMTNFPFETHVLEIKLRSQLPVRSVSLTLLDSSPTPVEEESSSVTTLPSGWTLKSNFSCTNGTIARTDRGRGNTPFEWATVTCQATVGKIDGSWFLNDLFLYFMIVLTNMFTCIGWTARPLSTITGGPIDQRELPIEMESRSGTLMALALAYIFAVGRDPYNTPAAAFAGSLPIMTRIYFIGLAALAVSALWSAILGVTAISAVRDRSTHPSCWSAMGIASKSKNAITVLSATVSHNKISPDAAQDGPEPDWETHAAKFRQYITKVDFWVILTVHILSITYTLIVLIVGLIDYNKY